MAVDKAIAQQKLVTNFGELTDAVVAQAMNELDDIREAVSQNKSGPAFKKISMLNWAMSLNSS